MIKPITTSIIFMLSASFFNIYEMQGEWNWASFLWGVICGIPLITIHWKNKQIAWVLTFTGLALLFLSGIGAFEGVEHDRLFFVGITLGAILGVIPGVYFNRPKSFVILAICCRIDKNHTLADMFLKKHDDSIDQQL